MKKRIFTLIFLCVFYMPNVKASPEVSAKSAVCIHYGTGQVLYAKNAEEKLPMASTTKIMTALLALEKGDLEEVVTIGANAQGVEGSSMYLKVGETLTLRELLYGLMLSSGNDAAVAIAEHIAGTEEAFAVMMTERAKEMGCHNTNFKNANGLPDDEHYTTALELARISGKALENETFREIVRQKSARAGGRYLSNHNKMLSLYEGAIGVKTGYTKAAGRTLVSAAEREGIMLIAVTLNAPDDWEDHKKILDEGFASIELRKLAEKDMPCLDMAVVGGTKESVPVHFAESFSLPVIKNKKVETKFQIIETLSAPVSEGEMVGKAVFYLEGVPMGETGLYTGESVSEKERPGFWNRFLFVLERWGILFS